MIDTTSTGNGTAVHAAAADADATDKPRFYLWQAGKVATGDPPPWLVGSAAMDGILPAYQMTVLYGPSGEGKTFAALDLAFCVAAGIPWHGYPVEKGPVVYVAAEGLFGIGVRLEALRRHHGLPALPEDLHFVKAAVQLSSDREPREMIRQVRSQGVNPVLIVVDTLARCLVGHDENTALHMGLAVANASLLKDELEAAVLLIHHSGLSGHMRGSTALLGAVDKQIKASKSRAGITLASEKTKDGPDFKALKFVMKTVKLDDIQPGLTSCVLVRHTAEDHAHEDAVELDAVEGDEFRATQAPPRPPGRSLRIVLEAFAVAPEGLTTTEAETICTTRRRGRGGRGTIGRAGFFDAMGKLTGDDEDHPLRRLGEKGVKGTKIVITDRGRAMLQELRDLAR